MLAGSEGLTGHHQEQFLVVFFGCEVPAKVAEGTEGRLWEVLDRVDLVDAEVSVGRSLEFVQGVH